MKPLYCDTSVLVAYYVPEVFSDQAERLLAGQDSLLISSLVMTETASALRRKVLNRILSQDDAQAAWKDFRQDVAAGSFRVLEPEHRHFAHAETMIWRAKAPLRTLDALHLALADLEGAAIVTADLVMAEVARSHRISLHRVGA